MHFTAQVQFWKGPRAGTQSSTQAEEGSRGKFTVQGGFCRMRTNFNDLLVILAVSYDLAARCQLWGKKAEQEWGYFWIWK